MVGMENWGAVESEMGQGESEKCPPPLKWREYALTVLRAREERPVMDGQRQRPERGLRTLEDKTIVAGPPQP